MGLFRCFYFVTGNISVTGDRKRTSVVFKNCVPFIRCINHINDIFIDEAENIDIIMHMFNLSECGDNYSDTPASWWSFKRDEAPADNAHVAINNSIPFKYKASLIRNTVVDMVSAKVTDTKIAVAIKHLSN